MRILTIAEGFPWEQEPQRYVFVWRQMQALIERGHEFRVLRMVPRAPGFSERWRLYRDVPERYDYQGQPVRIVRAFVAPRMYGLPLVRLQVGAAIEREIASFRPDLIHAHSLLIAGFLAMGHGVPMVLTAHGSDAYALPYSRPGLLRAARQVVARADEIVAVSEFVAGHVASLGKPATVIHNGADERVFFPRDRATSRAALDIGAERFVVVFVANLKAAKGTAETARALAALADLRPLLLVAGTGAERERMEAVLGAAGIETRFLGNVEHDVLAEAYGAADAVILPSHAEGLPVVVCETMLSGRVMVTTPVGGVPELVRDGRNGILIPAKDPVALEMALRRLREEPERSRSIEVAAAAEALERVTWRRNALSHEPVYQRALGRRSVAKP